MSKRVFLAVAVILAIVVLLTGPARADSIAVANYSFESNVVADGTQTTTTTDWTVEWGPGSYVYTRNPTSGEFASAGGNGVLPAPADRSQCLKNTATSYQNDVALLGPLSGLNIPATFANGGPSVGNGNGGLQSGVTYTMSVAVGCASNSGIFDGFSFGFVDSNAGVGVLIKNNEFPAGQNPSPGTFTDFTASFNGSDFINVGKIKQDDAITPMIILGAGAYMDNVRISISETGTDTEGTLMTPAANLMEIPEPSTLALLAAGMLSLLAYVWRNRN